MLGCASPAGAGNESATESTNATASAADETASTSSTEGGDGDGDTGDGDTGDGDGECELAPITQWLNDQPMLGRRESQAVVWTAERMYALGGFGTGGAADDAWMTSFGDEGEPLALWDVTTTLPHRVQHHTAHIYGDWVYLIGGDSGLATYASIHVAPIEDDGSLGAWVERDPLAAPRSGHTSVIAQDRLYLFGGFDSFTDSITTSVASAPLGADGTLGTWEEHQALPEPTAWHAMTQLNGRVYMAGGLVEQGGGSIVSNQVRVAELGDTLSAWSDTTGLPAVRYRFALVASDDGLVSMGGADNSGTATPQVYQAGVNEDGSVTAWVESEPFPEARFAQATAWRDGRVWALGGYFDTVQNQARDTVFTGTYCSP